MMCQRFSRSLVSSLSGPMRLYCSAAGNRRVYIGNLPWSVTENDLFQKFGDYGSITNARVSTDPTTQTSRGFAFIEFDSSSSAASAIEEMNNQEWMGRTLRVSVASKSERGERGADRGAPAARRPRRDPPVHPPNSNLYVGNLPFNMREADIREAFSEFGTVVRVFRPIHLDTQRPKGYAYVQMATVAQAEHVISMSNTDNLVMDGRSVLVRFGKPTEDVMPHIAGPEPVTMEEDVQAEEEEKH
eukprot:CAMPEP_0177669434 /NCGR_PEP_ID=MMETSP0447-20121125/23446_1 /TAXON_ID=0 /ORGANISM="Stygamoeba regulata, Strain BSH-02190019" /LENGTH=243 /DNA_ID=CAMNT_0019176315 /DNA_START=170 /DNA_END=901 /DNA_ORIENTATION=+